MGKKLIELNSFSFVYIYSLFFIYVVFYVCYKLYMQFIFLLYTKKKLENIEKTGHQKRNHSVREDIQDIKYAWNPCNNKDFFYQGLLQMFDHSVNVNEISLQKQ